MGPKRKQGNDEAQQTLLGFFQSPSHSSTPSTSENDLSPSKSTHDSAFSYEESNSETRPKAKNLENTIKIGKNCSAGWHLMRNQRVCIAHCALMLKK